MRLRSKITSKFQITIPKEVRDSLKLGEADVLEWRLDESGIHVEAADKPFLKYGGFLNTGCGDTKEDVKLGRKLRAERYRK
jgi:AbrB family looped-hinge helix DNA binding protein